MSTHYRESQWIMTLCGNESKTLSCTDIEKNVTCKLCIKSLPTNRRAAAIEAEHFPPGSLYEWISELVTVRSHSFSEQVFSGTPEGAREGRTLPKRTPGEDS